MSLALSSFSADATTILLVILLVSAFVVAFKIMKMVMESIFVAAISGTFYVAMAMFVLEANPSLNSFLLYAFLGSGLYMAFSFLSSAYSLVGSLLEIPYRIALYALKPFKWIYSHFREKRKLENLRQKLEKEGEKLRGSKDKKDSSNNGADTKEVVLDKVNPKEDD